MIKKLKIIPEYTRLRTYIIVTYMDQLIDSSTVLTLNTMDGDIKVVADDILPYSPVLETCVNTLKATTIPLYYVSKQDMINIIEFLIGKPIDVTTTIHIVRRLEMKDLLYRMLAIRWNCGVVPNGITMFEALLDLKDICGSNHFLTNTLYLNVLVQIITSIRKRELAIKKELITILFAFLFDHNKDLAVLFEKLYDNDEEMYNELRNVITCYRQSNLPYQCNPKPPITVSDFFTCEINLNWSSSVGHEKLLKLVGLTNTECKYIRCDKSGSGRINNVIFKEYIKVNTETISTLVDQLIALCQTHKIDSHGL